MSETHSAFDRDPTPWTDNRSTTWYALVRIGYLQSTAIELGSTYGQWPASGTRYIMLSRN